jgi:hypothetical protein
MKQLIDSTHLAQQPQNTFKSWWEVGKEKQPQDQLQRKNSQLEVIVVDASTACRLVTATVMVALCNGSPAQVLSSKETGRDGNGIKAHDTCDMAP